MQCLFIADPADKFPPYGAFSTVKHTIVCLPPLPRPAAARLARALGSRAAASPLTVGHVWNCSSSTALRFLPLFLLPPTPKAFIGNETSLIENSPEIFGLLNCAGSSASLLYAHLSYIPSLAHSIKKSLSDWQVWKSSPLNTSSGISPAVPGHCQAPAPQPRCPGRREVRGGKAPSQPRCPRELPVPQGQTAPTPRRAHSPPHAPPTPTAGARLSPRRTRNTGRWLSGSPKPVPARREGMGRRALGCPSRVLWVPWGEAGDDAAPMCAPMGERTRSEPCAHRQDWASRWVRAPRSSPGPSGKAAPRTASGLVGF